MECFACFVFLASTIIHSAFGLVIDSVRADYIFRSKSTFGDFFGSKFGCTANPDFGYVTKLQESLVDS